LNISSYHPEHWNPSWSVHSALIALIAFMPSPGEGALGSLNYSEEEKRALALRSRQSAPIFGSKARQEVTNRIHDKMLKLLPRPASQSKDDASEPVQEAVPPKGEQRRAREDGAERESNETKPGDGRQQVRERRRGPRDLIWSTILWLLMALATCAVIRNLARDWF